MRDFPLENGNMGSVLYEDDILRMVYESFHDNQKTRIVMSIRHFNGPGIYLFSEGVTEVKMQLANFRYDSIENQNGFVKIVDYDLFKKTLDGAVTFKISNDQFGTYVNPITEWFSIRY